MKPAAIYLNFNGTAEEAFLTYKSVFGGEFTTLQRFCDNPGSDSLPPEAREKIMHIALPLPSGPVLMATDALESAGFNLVQGNAFHIALDAENRTEAQYLFNQLSAGGKIEMDLQETSWGAYFAIFTDRFGVHWMINCDSPV